MLQHCPQAQHKHSTVLLFLDIDGVLLPAPSPDTPEYRDVSLDPHRHNWSLARLLADVLLDFPEVRIVVSSSWARFFELKELKRFLAPLPIVAAITHRIGTRYEDIRSYLYRREEAWLALDDDDRGWPAEERHHLVHCEECVGLVDPSRIAELVQKLEALREVESR